MNLPDPDNLGETWRASPDYANCWELLVDGVPVGTVSVCRNGWWQTPWYTNHPSLDNGGRGSSSSDVARSILRACLPSAADQAQGEQMAAFIQRTDP